jgi:phospholipid transport system substrate-binding protein
MIRSTVEQVTAVLQDPVYQHPDRRQERFQRVRELVLPHFDSRELAKRALGLHWRDRTEEERQEFTRLVIDLVESSYRRTLERYTSAVQIVYDQEHIEEPFAEVDTHLRSPTQLEPIAITYRLHKVGDQWLIYDMVIANVSLVRNYRTQFERILSTSSYAELIRSIERKLRELNAPPAS